MDQKCRNKITARLEKPAYSKRKKWKSKLSWDSWKVKSGNRQTKNNQKNADPSNTELERKKAQVQILNTDGEQNKETDDTIYPWKYWGNVAEESNELKDRIREVKGEINHSANNHKKKMIDKESKGEIQDNAPLEKETLNVNIETSQ